MTADQGAFGCGETRATAGTGVKGVTDTLEVDATRMMWVRQVIGVEEQQSMGWKSRVCVIGKVPSLEREAGWLDAPTLSAVCPLSSEHVYQQRGCYDNNTAGACSNGQQR